jgi:hypothetical protein
MTDQSRRASSRRGIEDAKDFAELKAEVRSLRKDVVAPLVSEAKESREWRRRTDTTVAELRASLSSPPAHRCTQEEALDDHTKRVRVLEVASSTSKVEVKGIRNWGAGLFVVFTVLLVPTLAAGVWAVRSNATQDMSIRSTSTKAVSHESRLDKVESSQVVAVEKILRAIEELSDMRGEVRVVQPPSEVPGLLPSEREAIQRILQRAEHRANR